MCKKFRKIEALNDLVSELSAKPIASGGLDQKLGLLVHGETRFASNSYMLERYVLLLSVLSAIIQMPFITGTNGMKVKSKYKTTKFKAVMKTIADKALNKKISKLADLLASVTLAIKLCDHSAHCTSKVYPAYMAIKKKFNEWEPWANGRDTLKTPALAAINERWSWMEFDIHYAAYACDPEFHNDDMQTAGADARSSRGSRRCSTSGRRPTRSIELHGRSGKHTSSSRLWEMPSMMQRRCTPRNGGGTMGVHGQHSLASS